MELVDFLHTLLSVKKNKRDPYRPIRELLFLNLNIQDLHSVCAAFDYTLSLAEENTCLKYSYWDHGVSLSYSVSHGRMKPMHRTVFTKKELDLILPEYKKLMIDQIFNQPLMKCSFTISSENSIFLNHFTLFGSRYNNGDLAIWTDNTIIRKKDNAYLYYDGPWGQDRVENETQVLTRIDYYYKYLCMSMDQHAAEFNIDFEHEGCF